MSGPKVVRIVTREEILEICAGHLARVDAALEEWIRVGRRNDSIDDEAIEVARRRRDALAALIAADRFLDLQKQAPIEELYLCDDIQSRLSAAAAKQAAARAREGRARDAAASLLRRLRAIDGLLDAELEQGLERGDQAALSKGFQRLSTLAATPAASADLASKLRDDTPILSFSDWRARQASAPRDPAIERIEARLIELGAMAGNSDLSRWRTRLAEAEEASPARRHLLIDALEVETGRTLTEVRSKRALLIDLRLVHAELKAAGASIAEAENFDDLGAAQLRFQVDEAKKRLDAHRGSRAAAARRAAVLQGLSSLGYEVTEGMSTALAENGQLVVKSATRPDYGVEISAAAGTERMQMRVVAFETDGRGPDSRRDSDAETIWCSEVATLQNSLAARGGHLAIERALAPGATPLKRIVISHTETTNDLALPKPRERNLR